MKWIVAAIIAFNAIMAVAYADDALVLDTTAGPAPLTVTITKPEVLVSLIARCRHTVGFITPAFSIDWGDGTYSPDYFRENKRGQSCADAKTHTYTVSGTYVIKAHRYHLGPTDAPETDWEGTAEINVGASAGHDGAAVDILKPQAGETFLYQQLSDIRWRIRTDKKVDVRIRLIGPDGAIIAETLKENIAYNGEGRDYLNLAGNARYEAALRNDQNPFTLEIASITDGAVTSRAQVDGIILSAETDLPDLRPRAEPARGKTPLHVTLAYKQFHPACFSYRINWGDDTPVEQQIKPAPQKGCLLDATDLVLTHTYKKPGTYDIVIHSNNLNPFTPLDDIASYQRAHIEALP